jgi:hypothetical protein
VKQGEKFTISKFEICIHSFVFLGQAGTKEVL